MKNVFTLLLILMFGFACSDDDSSTDPPIEPTDFISEYLNNLVIRTTQVDAPDYEFGVGFQTAKPGTITHFNTTMPKSGQYRVTLWDGATETVLVTATVNQSADNQTAKQPITSFDIQANKEYYITIQANNWHEWASDLQSTSDVIPYTIGDYTITRYGWDFTTEQSFPDSFRTDYIAGAVSFDFTPNP